MENFNGFDLPPALRQALVKLGFTKPTPIQTQAIPLALTGRDILGSAQTGTGKTAAFGIPLVTKLINNPSSAALIMTPTRELATQVLKQLQELLGHPTTIRSALLIGGDSMGKQLGQLRALPRLIVGTPGRINDHLMRRTLNLTKTDFLVLDETDRMLDMGFGVQLEKIIKHMPKDRQTLMFSATMPHNIMKLASQYLRNPERIAVGSTITAAPKIKQELIHTSDAEKYGKLVELLESRSGSIIVFVKTKHGADRLATKLEKNNHSADAIHGDLRQRQRDRVIQNFRDKKHRIMVATDVAARGLDIPHIEHVINYDLPQAPEDYIHRIGRTARAGAEGSAVCLITPADGEKWRAIHRLMNPGAPPPPRGPRQPGANNNAASRSSRPPYKGGYGKKTEGSYGKRSEGGFGKRTEGSFSKTDNEGGYAKKTEGHFGKRSEGHFSKRAEGGFKKSGSEGGYAKKTEGGFGKRTEGGFSKRTEGGLNKKSGGNRTFRNRPARAAGE